MDILIVYHVITNSVKRSRMSLNLYGLTLISITHRTSVCISQRIQSVQYRDKPVKAVWWSIWCIIRTSYKTQKYNLFTNREGCMVKQNNKHSYQGLKGSTIIYIQWPYSLLRADSWSACHEIPNKIGNVHIKETFRRFRLTIAVEEEQ